MMQALFALSSLRGKCSSRASQCWLGFLQASPQDSCATGVPEEAFTKAHRRRTLRQSAADLLHYGYTDGTILAKPLSIVCAQCLDAALTESNPLDKTLGDAWMARGWLDKTLGGAWMAPLSVTEIIM